MRHYCTVAGRSALIARANATQIYWVAASGFGHLPSPCAAAKYPRKIYASRLGRGGKGIGNNKPESSRRSRARFAQSYDRARASSAGRQRSRGNRLPTKVRGSNSGGSRSLRNAGAVFDPWTNCTLRKLYHSTRSSAGSHRRGRSKSETSGPCDWASPGRRD